MPLQSRVTPLADLVADPARGLVTATAAASAKGRGSGPSSWSVFGL